MQRGGERDPGRKLQVSREKEKDEMPDNPENIVNMRSESREHASLGMN